jgi:hypothetical protein
MTKKTNEPTLWIQADHQGWGNAINWDDYEKCSLSGHIDKTNQGGVKVGDILHTPLQSGNIGVFEITEVSYFNREPLDMFFAKAKPLRKQTKDGVLVENWTEDEKQA